MVTAPGNRLQAHFGRYTTHLYLVIAAMLVGVLFGVLAVGTLSVADRLSLMSYVKQFVDLEASSPTYRHVFQPALAQNLKLLGLLYVLGVSVAGMPLVLLVVFFRGFVLGFAATFLVQGLQWRGAAIGTATMGIASVFLLPALVIAAAVALGFSWDLISPAARRKGPGVGKAFAFFTGLVIVMAAVTLVGTALESYVSPFLLHLLGHWGM